MLDVVEAVTNATLGLVVSFCLTWLWLGFAPVQSIVITGVFFGASTARAYLLRLVFRRIDRG